MLLFQDENDVVEMHEGEHHHELIKTKKGIVLSPQPHEDPNDPLVRPICLGVLSILIIELARVETEFDVGCAWSTLSHRRWPNSNIGSWIPYSLRPIWSQFNQDRVDDGSIHVIPRDRKCPLKSHSLTLRKATRYPPSF